MLPRSLLAAAAVLGFCIATPAFAQFKDVSAARADAQAISYVFSQGVVKGYADGTFRPDASINRAEFAKIAVLMFWDGDQRLVDMCDSVHFDDVARGQWYFHSICSAKDQSIIDGYPGTRLFRPANVITVAEATKMIANAFKFRTESGNPWYASYVRALADRRALPTSLGSLGKPITRGELAEIAFRLRTNTITKPSLTYAQLTGEQDLSTDPCTAPISDEPSIGDTYFPTAPRYARLKKLGGLFTAADCGSQRLAQFYGDLSTPMGHIRLQLKAAPSSGLYNTLYDLGFAPRDGNVTAESRSWVLDGSITVRRMLQLHPYADEIQFGDCTDCG